MPQHTTSTTKTCSKCGATKPATTEYFCRDKNRRDGLYPQCKECQRKYRQGNKVGMSENFRAWMAANPGRKAELDRAWREANPDRASENERAWRRAYPERYAETRRAWQREHPNVVAAGKARRRAAKLIAPGSYTPADILAIYEEQGGRCLYCQAELDGKYHRDHVVPLARGGSNGPENMACACASCNTSKGDKFLSEWGFK